MFNFLHDFNIQTIAQFIQAHPHSANIFIYLICFAEAMAVIGAFVPGTIAMPAIGFLIGLSLIPAGSTLMWVILGAATGDILSYLIGVYFQDRIHRVWPFTKWPNLLTRGEKFFRAHGGKSVFIGRFVGPLRAVMPMIAGMFKMSFLRFLLIALVSIVIWSLVYIIPGALLGALSLELPAGLVTKFAIGGVVAFIVLWAVVWLSQHFFRQIWQMIDYYTMQFWRYLQRHKSLSWIAKYLSDPRESDNHLQLALAMIIVPIFILFLWSLYQILTSGALVDLSYSIYHLLSSLRFERLDSIFVLITFFGDISLILIASTIILLWLLRKKQWYVALHLFGITAFSVVMVGGIKLLINSSRPGDILYEFYDPAFPSAHTTLALSLYGFLAVIIARELVAPKKYFAYIAAAVLTTVVSFSRLYLGAHWLIDVFGGILLGLMLLLAATISYRRHRVLQLHVRDFILFVVGTLAVIWFCYSAVFFEKQAKAYALIWPTQVITFDDLITDKESKVPLYRVNRLGHPIEAFNVAYIGNLTDISQTLLRQGWEPQPTSLNVQNMIKSFSQTSIINHLTAFPQLYHNKKVSLLFTKSTRQKDVIIILRLWLSDIDLKDNNYPLWIGTVEYHHSSASIFSLKLPKKQRLFVGATEFLSRYLKAKDFYLRQKNYPLKKQPPEMQELKWDGNLLIIINSKA